MKHALAFVLVVVALSCSGSMGTGGTGGGTGSAGGGSGGSGGEVMPHPNTPDAGCITGYTACTVSGSTPVCSDLATDRRNCKACGVQCDPTSNCGATGCVDAGTTCPSPQLDCGGSCVRDQFANAVHCGACFNQCGARELCQSSRCVSGQGNGASCDSPLIIPTSTSDRAGFHFDRSLTSSRVFTCGPLTALPTRWFRFTANNGDKLELRVRDDSDAVFHVELFDSCAGASLLCAEQVRSSNSARYTVVPGKTYFVAVGLTSGTPIAPLFETD